MLDEITVFRNIFLSDSRYPSICQFVNHLTDKTATLVTPCRIAESGVDRSNHEPCGLPLYNLSPPSLEVTEGRVNFRVTILSSVRQWSQHTINGFSFYGQSKLASYPGQY